MKVDAVSGHAQLVGDVLGHLDVEAGERAVRVLQAEARLVELDADRDRAGLGVVDDLRLAGDRGGDRLGHVGLELPTAALTALPALETALPAC